MLQVLPNEGLGGCIFLYEGEHIRGLAIYVGTRFLLTRIVYLEGVEKRIVFRRWGM